MDDFQKYLEPNRKGFESDPFGYSALAREKWGMAQTMAGFPVDISKPATKEELKDPVLWLSQAHALSETAAIVLKNNPNLDVMPKSIRGACDSQYCAVGLMLVGYSLEICLKAIIIMREGIESYIEIERKVQHHRLHDLAGFIPNLTTKEKVILMVLTHFVSWAGRYPDPGTGREAKTEEVFTLSEKHRISAKDLFLLSSKVMSYSQSTANML